MIRPLQIYAERDELLEFISTVACRLDCRMECVGTDVFLLKGAQRIAECRLAQQDDSFVFESVLNLDDAHVDPKAARIVKKTLVENFNCGLWFVNEALAVREFYREFWYSDGALESQRNGKVFKQFPSSTVHAVADPDASLRYAGERKRIIEALR